MKIKAMNDKEYILAKHRTEHGSASLKEIYDAMDEYAQCVLKGYIDANTDNSKEGEEPKCKDCNGTGLCDGKGYSDTPWICRTCNGSGR